MGRDQLFARSCTEIQAIVHGKKLQHVQLELFSISYPAAKATTYAPVPLKAEAQSWSVGRFPEGSAEMLHVKSGTNVYTRHDAESEPRLSQETYKTMQNQIMRRHGSAITNRILQTSYHNVLYDLDPIINHDERGTCRYTILCKKTLHQFVQVAQKHATGFLANYYYYYYYCYYYYYYYYYPCVCPPTDKVRQRRVKAAPSEAQQPVKDGTKNPQSRSSPL